MGGTGLVIMYWGGVLGLVLHSVAVASTIKTLEQGIATVEGLVEVVGR